MKTMIMLMLAIRKETNWVRKYSIPTLGLTFANSHFFFNCFKLWIVSTINVGAYIEPPPSFQNRPILEHWCICISKSGLLVLARFLTVAGLAQSVERLTAEWKVAGSIPGAGPLLRVLKWLQNEGTSFALKTARPSRGSDDHVKWRSRLH